MEWIGLDWIELVDAHGSDVYCHENDGKWDDMVVEWGTAQDDDSAQRTPAQARTCTDMHTRIRCVYYTRNSFGELVS